MAKMFFSTSEVADLFNVNRVTIYRWVKEGMVKGYKVGKHPKIPLAEVERMKREFGFGDVPLEKLQGGQAGAADAGRAPLRGPSFKKIVMAIDDDENILSFMQSAFEGLGLNRHCSLKTYSNGLEAVDMARRFPYDLILMDCLMPELDGFEATRRLRRDLPSDRRLPIIALTAGATAEDQQRCREAGMDDFLTKPLQREAFFTVLEHWARILGKKGA
ncbi:MAG TPA: response regulator [Deltaproteobacteria bacterium]|nr:response regulator [Deltaproteobacteria bacterium]